MKKRLLSILLTACLLMGLLPTVALAAEDGVKYLDDKGVEQRYTGSYTEITQNYRDWELTAGWYVVTGNVTGPMPAVEGDVHLILADNCSLSLDCLHVFPGHSLTIYAQSTDEETMGKLNSGDHAEDVGSPTSGIGGGGTITINGGKITASGFLGAGIGGYGHDQVGDGGIVTINGGIVTATSTYGAGIGGGGTNSTDGGDGGIITINGGTVIATSTYGAGIGGGYGLNRGGNGGTVTINGGDVTASSGTSDVVSYSAGIGGGGNSMHGGSGADVTITGGTVTASTTNPYIAAIGWSGPTADSPGALIITGGDITPPEEYYEYYGIAGIKPDGGSNLVAFGNLTLPVDLTIPEGKTLTIPSGASLTIPEGKALIIPEGVTLTIAEGDTLTNNGTIINSGTIIGTVSGNTPKTIAAKYLDETGEEQTAFCDTAITAANPLATLGEQGKTTWYVVTGDVEIDSHVTVNGIVHLILADGCELTLADGLTAEGNLTIYAQSTGDAKGCMHVVGPDITGSNSRSCGIELRGGLTINGGSIIAKGGDADDSYGIYVTERNAGNDTDVNGYIEIHGGTVLVTGGSENITSCGIYVEHDLSMTGGILTAIGSGAEAQSIGVIVRSLSISGGTITGAGGDADEVSAGIVTDSELKITGSTVTATGGSAKYSYGIYGVEGEYSSFMSVSEQANVIAIGGDAELYSRGIYMEEKLTITGGTVTATGGSVTATGNSEEARSVGILTYGELTITGGTVTATGGAAAGSVGILTGQELTITGGTVTATGGTVTATGDVETMSYGIFLRDNEDNELKISDCHVIAQTLAETATTKAALIKEPNLDEYSGYYWRTGTEDPFTASTFTAYTYRESDTYVEFSNGYTYTITLNPNYEGSTFSTVITGTDGKLTTGNLPTPTRDGYTFDGWFTEATGGTEVTNETPLERNTTIYAHWTARSSGGGSGGVSTYGITVESAENGTVTVAPKTASKGTTVTLTAVPDKGYTLETLTVTDRNGNEIELTSKGDGKYTFKMPAGKVTVKATFMEDNSMLNFFVDVPADAYYYDAVLWAAENGITGGTDATHFSPNAPCTRAQIVTFLWRAAGSPEPENVSSFADVPADSYYAKAVAWAVEKGITKGTSDTTFSPNATCTRAQAMTFIYRSEQAQGGGMQGAWMFQNPFSDVDLENYYGEAVMWAVANGITKGTTATTFSPSDNCTRAQIVTFLFRCLGE